MPTLQIKMPINLYQLPKNILKFMAKENQTSRPAV